jgi:hypothetical protein
VVYFRREPHWLVVGATRSGKSTLLARLVAELAPQSVALVGVDCKGDMERALFGKRLSVLATSRKEAVALKLELFKGLIVPPPADSRGRGRRGLGRHRLGRFFRVIVLTR